MNQPLVVESRIHFQRRGRGARKVAHRGAPKARLSRPTGRVPRVARFMALAIRFEQLIGDGEVSDFAELARLGHVTRARITQIMNLRLLAPDIQEEILFLAAVERGSDPIYLRDLQPIALDLDWQKQRAMWSSLILQPAISPR